MSDSNLIVVHPDEKFDNNLRVKGSLNELLSKPYSNKLIISSNEEDLSSDYISANLDGIDSEISEFGSISESMLSKYVKNNSNLELVGGAIKQCHKEAFVSIIRYAQTHSKHNITISLPFDACYGQASIPNESSSDGFVNSSFSLKEILTHSFLDLVTSPDLGELDDLDLDLDNSMMKENFSNIVIKHYTGNNIWNSKAIYGRLIYSVRSDKVIFRLL